MPLTDNEPNDKLPLIERSPPTDTLPEVVIVLPSKLSVTVTSPLESNFKNVFARVEGIVKSVGAPLNDQLLKLYFVFCHQLLVSLV